jgi:hypothetical protein
MAGGVDDARGEAPAVEDGGADEGGVDLRVRAVLREGEAADVLEQAGEEVLVGVADLRGAGDEGGGVARAEGGGPPAVPAAERREQGGRGDDAAGTG